tara:strand:- start:3696 stop:4469 length:774 start_codon:yes stop_codon:yes gene_type:complete
MIFNFYKYQGTGNDFILIDCRDINYNFSTSDVSKICDRKFGIGSDGIMIIKDHPEFDFEMQFYNPDGTMSFCGNGTRCAVLFCFHNGLCSKKTKFLTNDGIHHGEIIDAENVKIDIVSPIKVDQLSNGDFKTNTGSPHYVKFVQDLKVSDLIDQCKAIRFSDEYKEEGINVNMAKGKEDLIEMRTYERGVENETLSCGSGVTAAALSFASFNDIDDVINVNTKGGPLKVNFKRENGHFNQVYLTGSAHFVFRGEFSL